MRPVSLRRIAFMSLPCRLVQNIVCLSSLSSALMLLSFTGVAFLAPDANSQVVTATLTGTVTDSTGASIPNAAVTATQPSTGVARSTQTNNEGVNTIPYLNP